MDLSSLSLVDVSAQKRRTLWHLDFEPSEQFVMPWWGPQHAIQPEEHWLAACLNGQQVARCKFMLWPGPRSHPMLGPMPYGQLDILAFEVAVSARGQGVGRAVLRAIREMHPLPRLTALNDNAESRKFWDAVGWVRHEARFPGVERVTYSEV